MSRNMFAIRYFAKYLNVLPFWTSSLGTTFHQLQFSEKHEDKKDEIFSSLDYSHDK